MNRFLTVVLALLLFVPVVATAADNGIWYNPERDGEGINLVTEDTTAVVFFYTFNDYAVARPPVVSPAPPPVDLVCLNEPTWYIGQSVNYDGNTATGELYVAEAFEYPFTIDGTVGTVDQIGTFTLLREGDGWVLDIVYSSNYNVPWQVSLYDIHEFPTALLTY